MKHLALCGALAALLAALLAVGLLLRWFGMKG